MAALCSHIPGRGEQTVRYLGYYSNVKRDRLKKEDESGLDYYIPEDEYPKKINKSWARLIRKIYEADPLICHRCTGGMRIIAFISRLW